MKPFLNIIRFVENYRYIVLLGLIITVGIILRFYGIFNAENTDEYNEVIEALRVASGKFNYERWWKKGYQNILAILYGVYYIIGYLLGQFNSPMHFAERIIPDMYPLFIIGRFTTAIMGIMSIILLYNISKNLWNERVGLFAAFFLSVESIHVWTSHLVNTDIPLTFFFLVSLYFTSRMYNYQKVSDFLLGSFFAAVAVNIKAMGIAALMLFIFFYIAMLIREKELSLKNIFTKKIFYSIAAFLIGIIVSNPPIVIGIKKFIQFHYNVYTNLYEEVPYAKGVNAYWEYFKICIDNFGLPFIILTTASFLYFLYKKESNSIVLILYAIIMVAILGNTTFLVQDRYLMIVFPAIFMLVGNFLDKIITKLTSSVPRYGIYAIIISITISSPMIHSSYSYDKTLTNENTSVLAKQWIETNIPNGSKILIDAGKTIITSGPRLNQSNKNIIEMIEKLKQLKDGETYDSPLVRIVDSYSSVYFELLQKKMPKITYDITSTELGRNVESTEYYKNNGYQYFIHNTGLEFRIKDPLWTDKYPKSEIFYNSMNRDFELIKTIRPTEYNSGSEIRIYKIN
jgi:hypothetical protein